MENNAASTQVKLPHVVIVRAPGLLPMLYTLTDLEEDLGVSSRRIREWLEKGAPYQRDPRGHFLINGEQFAEWVEAVQESQKKPKVIVREGEAYCFRCNAAVPLENPTEVRTGKQLRLRSHCPHCNTTVYRGVSYDRP